MAANTALDILLPLSASAFGMIMYFSNVLEVQAFKNENNGPEDVGKSHWPYLMLVSNAFVWMLYGIEAGIKSIYMTNSLGILIALYCFFVYYQACSRTKHQVKLHATLVAATAFFYALYVIFSKPSLTVLGIVASTVCVFMFASPLSVILLVINARSSSALPTGFCVVGFLCSLSWTLFGIRSGDVFMYMPNGIGLCFSAIQVLLLLYYPKTGSQVDDNDV